MLDAPPADWIVVSIVLGCIGVAAAIAARCSLAAFAGMIAEHPEATLERQDRARDPRRR